MAQKCFIFYADWVQGLLGICWLTMIHSCKGHDWTKNTSIEHMLVGGLCHFIPQVFFFSVVNFNVSNSGAVGFFAEEPLNVFIERSIHWNCVQPFLFMTVSIELLYKSCYCTILAGLYQHKYVAIKLIYFMLQVNFKEEHITVIMVIN